MFGYKDDKHNMEKKAEGQYVEDGVWLYVIENYYIPLTILKKKSRVEKTLL